MAKAKKTAAPKEPTEETPPPAEKPKPTGMRLLRMKVENFMRIIIAEIAPNGESIDVWGKNEQGKSSLLNALWVALGGADAEPDVPVRKGEKEANIEVTLGEINTPQLIVKYRRKADEVIDGKTVKGKRYIELFRPDGAKFDAPQTQLDKLTNGKMFDPLSFMRLKPSEQAKIIARIAGIDIVAFEQKRKGLYDQRTEANRRAKEAANTVKALEGELQTAMQAAGLDKTPDKRVEIDEYMQKIQEAQDHNGKVMAARSELETIIKPGHNSLIAKHKEAEVNLEKVKATAEKAIAEAVEQMNRAALKVKQSEEAKASIEADVAKMTMMPTEQLQEQVKKAEPINNAVRLADALNQAKTNAKDKQEAADEADRRVMVADKEHLDAIANAKLPIPGMGFTSEGVTIDGLPLEQQAASVRLRLSAEITACENQLCRVMCIQDASLLDNDMRKILQEVGEKRNVQLMMEYVAEQQAGGIQISEGRIA